MIIEKKPNMKTADKEDISEQALKLEYLLTQRVSTHRKGTRILSAHYKTENHGTSHGTKMICSFRNPKQWGNNPISKGFIVKKK